MKKVKTILTSLIIILATAFMTACSCGGNDDGNTVTIPVSTISISSNFAGAERDEETGFLTIKCTRNSEFDITYSLAPDNTTRTQVDWSFVGADDVVVSKRNYYSYSQGTTHTVTFVARKVGTTTIKFVPKNTDKWTQATIQVGEIKEAWPTFLAPTNLNYNSGTGCVFWSPVRQVRKADGAIINTADDKNIAQSPNGYEVTYTNLETNETATKMVGAECKIELPRGITYAVNVKAKGDNFTVNDSANSDTFTYHQIASVSDLKNNNGELTFTNPKNSYTNRIFYSTSEALKDKYIETSSTRLVIDEIADINNYSRYDIGIVSLPQGYAEAVSAGRSYALNSLGVRIYPSVKSNNYSIIRLKSPVISVENKQGDITIDEAVFTKENGVSPYLSTILKWNLTGEPYDVNYQVKYNYAIYKEGVTTPIISGSGSVESADTTYSQIDLANKLGASNDSIINTSGNYKLVVYTNGNSTNTIPSSASTYNFKVLDKVLDTSTIINNVLKTSDAEGIIKGVDLYFVNKTNKLNSKHVFVDAINEQGGYTEKSISVDLTTLNLVAGEYDIYARNVGFDTTNYSSVTGAVNKINTTSVIISDPVDQASIELRSNGVLQFKKASSDIYTISIAKDNIKFAYNISKARDGETLYRSYENPGYTLNNGICSISIYDIIGKYLLNDSDSSNLESLIADFTSTTVKFTINSKGDGDSVDSSKSNTIQFERLKAIDVNSITLNNENLSFATESSNRKAIININGAVATINSNKENTINLKEIMVNENESLFDYTATKYAVDGKTKISIYILGNTASTGSDGHLDSFVTTKEIGYTCTPNSVSLDSDGKLTWKISETDGEQNFILRFYTQNAGIWTEAIESHKVIVTSETVDVGTEENPATENVFAYNIFDIISSIGANINIGVTIEHIDSTRFTNNASDMYYVIQLSNVAMQKVLDNSNPAIEFTTLDVSTSGIIYQIDVFSGETSTPNKYMDLIRNTNYRKTITGDLKLTEVGKYTLRIIAYRDNGNIANSETTPFVLSSVAEELNIEILDPRITAYGNGTMVAWNNVHDSATYKLYYKNDGASDYTLVTDDNGDAIIFNKDTLIYDLFDKLQIGKNQIKVIPSIDFEATGCLFTNYSDKVNDIIKLQTASDVISNDGKLTFHINEDLSDKNYSINLFVDGKLVANDVNMYTCDFELVKSGEDFGYILGTINILSTQYVGEHKYAIQVMAVGYISSEKSTEYTATKISTPTDVDKIGEYILWTPVEHATTYSLSFVKSGSNSGITKFIRFDGTTVTVETIDEAGQKIYKVDTNIAKFENGKLMYKFDSELLGADADAGDYLYTITPYTTKDTYLNGVTSSARVITKLSQDLDIAVENESLVLRNYSENGTQIPMTVDYTISRFKTEEVTIPAEGEGGPTTTTKVTILSTKTGSIDYNSIKEAITADGYALNLNDLGILDAGSYLIKVIFKGDGNSILDSNEIENNTFVKLDTSTLATKDGVISFVKVEGATSYTISISKLGVTSNDVTNENTDDETGDGSEENPETPVEPEVNAWTFTINATDGDSEFIDETNLILENGNNFRFETGKEYSVKLMANGESLSSRWSGEFIVKKLQAPTNLNITSTNGKITYTDEQGQIQTINVGDPILTWSNPNQVLSRLNYMLSIVGEGENNVDNFTIYNTTNDSVELLGSLLPKDKKIGKYTIKLKAIGNTTSGTNQLGLLTSNYSYEDITGSEGANPTISYIGDVYNIGLNQKQFTWANILGAYGYRISFFEGINADTKGTPIYSTYVTNNSYNFRNTEFAGSGYYTVVINAITDPSIAIVSTYQDENPETQTEPTNVSTLYKSADVTQLMVKDGMLSWSLKIADVKELLSPHTADDDILVTKLNVTETTADKKSTQLLNNTVDYISRKINQNVEGDADVDKVLNSLYSYRLNLNGVEMDVIPNLVDVVAFDETKTDLNERYVSKKGNYADTYLLMFKYSLTMNTIGDTPEGVENVNPGRYVVKVTPRGNNVNTAEKGLYTSVDGKYSSEITVYKPNTPSAWVRADESTTAKQISDGNIMWSLVTTDDSKPDNFVYHQNYMITAVSNENKDEIQQRELSVSDTIIADGELAGTNPNLKDNCNYYRYLKENGSLFGVDKIAYNTNYTLKVNVVGTKDSTLLGENEKAYLNSDMFTYTEYMNLLANLNTSVKNSKLEWSPCEDSTATRVVIYGPFTNGDGTPNYAPIEPERADYEKEADYTIAYNKWIEDLKAWKNSISTEWSEAIKPSNKTLRHEFIFPATIAGEGEETLTERIKSYTLTDKLDEDGNPYGAGSYIIRKGEIGNGKGVISTDFSEDLFVKADLVKADYEMITTKLDKVVKYAKADNSGWTKDGKFVWSDVKYANAYKVTLEKGVNQDGTFNVVDGGTYEEIVNITGENSRFGAITEEGKIVGWSYELPDNSFFNEQGYSYRLRITAMHVRTNNDISDNYFNSDEIATLDYSRTAVPTGVQIDGEGLITWDRDSQDSSGDGYIIRLNYGKETVLTEDISTKNKSYDLSKFNQTGTISFFVKTKGGVGYLNSCNAKPIYVNKLATPVVTIKDGVFTWGTESVEVSGEQLTDTIFILSNATGEIENTELDLTTTQYPLFSEIDGYINDYRLNKDLAKFPAGQTYTFAIKYKGDEGVNDGSNRTFNIASPFTNFKATKLGNTTLENVEIATGNNKENKVKWKPVENALGYRAVVVTNQLSADGTPLKFDKIFNLSNAEDKKYKENDEYFEVIDGEIYLNLTNVIAELNNATSLKVYVQAVGHLDYTDTTGTSTNNTTIYLSGSFSDGKTVEIPAKPSSASYDSKTGIVSWKVDDVNKAHNVQITTQYKVDKVKPADFENYWKVTSDTYREDGGETQSGQGTNRFAEITNRDIVYTLNKAEVEGEEDTYSISVIDTVFIKATNNLTPTQYQLTNIGNHYVFDIIVMVGDGSYNGMYRSEIYHLEDSSANGYQFSTYQFGDGSELLPYGIESAVQLNSIRNFTDRHFIITSNISLLGSNNVPSRWQIIEDEFTGSIDGNNKTISNVYIDSKTIESGMYATVKQAMFSTNRGTIKNLNLSVVSEYTSTTSQAQVMVAGLVIENYGTIDNVHIETVTDHAIKADYIGASEDRTLVAGIAIYNGSVNETGIIVDSSVTVNGNSDIKINGIYASDDSDVSSFGAGIVNYNYGTISNTYFSGDITANYIAGITNENYGTIDTCYAIGNARLTDAGKTNNSGTTIGKGMQFGGLVGIAKANSIINSSYARMNLSVTINATTQVIPQVGGLVAFVEGKTDITNSYTVASFSRTEMSQTNFNTSSIYYFSPRITGKLDNNYYYVETVTTPLITEQSSTSNSATRVNSLDDLKTNMFAIKNANGENIYQISETRQNIGGDGSDYTFSYTYPLLKNLLEKNILGDIVNG